ncbi:DsbC family protein [Fontimonas sp. SYSU GA230001]|uniref:DsbC family protein n=1 Tax=Fontimonas sp. SYSU GA230001 TaxID=3142450 RepID=UPI0032B36B9F
MTLRHAQTLLASCVCAWALAGCAPPYHPVANPEIGDAASASADIDTVRDNVTRVLTGVKRENIHPADAPGLYEIQVGSQFAYVTADGRYLIEGDLVDLVSGVSLTENKRKSERIARLAALGEDNMIVFGPERASDAQHTVTVFTDVDCGYCRKLHREIDEYTQRGITIRYAFYPRSGPNTESFRKAQAVWCSKDRKQALTLAKQGVPVEGDTSCPNPVMTEYQLGVELGLRGTPMLILPDGEVVNGYVPAARLAERLNGREQG